MKEKITEFLFTFILVLSFTFSFLVGITIFSVLITAIVQFLPPLAIIIFGFVVSLVWSIMLYRENLYPELNDAFRWHIIDYGDYLKWNNNVLEFDTKESAEAFLAYLVKHIDNNYFGCYITKDLQSTSQCFNATHYVPAYDTDHNEIFIPKEDV